MTRILFLHDTDLSLRRGAELTINQLVQLGSRRGFVVETDLLGDFETSQRNILAADLVVVNSTSRCKFEKELIDFLCNEEIKYAKIEFDYNFCARRNIICTVDPKYKLCCDSGKFHGFRKLFSNALLNCFQSPKHFESHREFYGEAIQNVLVMPPTVDVDALKISQEKDDSVIPFFGDLSFLKGARAFVQFASENPNQQFIVYGQNKTDLLLPSNISFHEMIDNEKVLEILGKTKRFFCQPLWPEPSGRLAAEAFLSGCEIIANDRIGTFSFDFYPNDIGRAKREMKETPDVFWDRIEQIIGAEKPKMPSLGKVLVQKNSGGLGDIFFSLPAIKLLTNAATEVHFAVAPRLVNFLSRYLPDVKITDQETANEKEFDTVIELGNYPAYMGFKLPNALKYTTHKRIRQHAIRHYLDAVSKLHRDLEYQKVEFPYFPKNTNIEKPYFTVHPGAGFLLKAWPAAQFAQVIREIHERYPELDCVIVLGPDDPDPREFFDDIPDFIRTETGNIEAVGQTLSGAMFHLGNDSGITHLAEAYNIPTVGIYGPTGPGAWGSFAQDFETIWGKDGCCNLKCDYTVLVNCKDRVCLSSVSIQKVMGAVLQLLQKIFPEMDSELLIHPALEIKFGPNNCLLKRYNAEFTINFTNSETREKVVRLLGGNFDNLDQETLQLVEFLSQQHMIIQPPKHLPLHENPKVSVIG